MDNQRLFTWGLAALMLFMTWQAWEIDYHTPAPEPGSIEEPPVAGTPSTAEGELPEFELPPTDATAQEPVDTPDAAPSGVSANLVHVRTDVLELAVDTEGGDIVSAQLLGYPVAKNTPDIVVSMLSPSADDFGEYRTGLRAANGGPEPNHLAVYTAQQSHYELGAGDSELVVPLHWSDPGGLDVVKRYRLQPGSYRIDLEYSVRNDSDAVWQAANYLQIVKTAKAAKRSMFDVDSYSFDGPVLYNGKKYKKYPPDDLLDDGPARLNASNGWLASIEHHFLVAAIPPGEVPYRYDLSLREQRFTASAISQARAVEAGGTEQFRSTLFVGPKLQSQLEEIAPSLKLTVDYGILTILAQPLFWLLDHVHDMVRNWGWSIIIVTILIKLVFYKLTAASGRSMAKMRNLQPRIKQIQDRYKDDRQQLSQAMMDLYKREKVNPAAGCLPILVQMPFFLAFYWVLLESVEMRQAPFMLWINDLSVRDPFFVLPVLMGVAMFFQQRLNPAPPDPIQARVMSILPIVFTVFFAFFPAGLVLYWFTNTLLSILQQWRINQVVAADDKKRRS